MESKPHIMVVPHPAQGHVAPLMKVAYKIVEHGIKVTFVNTEPVYEKIMASMSREDLKQSLLRLVSIPDGLESDEERKDPFKFTECIFQVTPVHLKELINKINLSSDDDKITCLIADSTAYWALQVAKEMGIKRAAVVPFSAESLALIIQIPELIEAGVFDKDGNLLKGDQICLSKGIAAWRNNELSWSLSGKPENQKMIFQSYVHNRKFSEAIESSDWLLVNSFYELEPFGCQLVPNILPIGPLTANDTHLGYFAGNFWQEDPTCLTWLDKQPIGSVIYVAFGSSTHFNQQQLDEVAYSLELTGRPFLWAARSDITNGTCAKFPDGFMERINGRGKVVSWAPQENVLSHPSIACFVSHCGWNSTMEGIRNGLSFLCWPYFCDQFHNMRAICETWRTGIGLTSNKEGIVSRHEIAAKVTELLADEVIKSNAIKLKELATKSIGRSGSSFRNFKWFIQQIMN